MRKPRENEDVIKFIFSNTYILNLLSQKQEKLILFGNFIIVLLSRGIEYLKRKYFLILMRLLYNNCKYLYIIRKTYVRKI